MQITDEELERQAHLEAAQAAQGRAHELDPYRVPLYLPADDPEFGTEAWTAGGPIEDS